MDPYVSQALASVADVSIRNSIEAIYARISASKAHKNDQETINVLSGIVQELIDDRNRLEQAIDVLQEQFVAQKISNDDIEFINQKIIPVLESLIPDGSDDDSSFEHVKQLLSVEMLTILQVIGFNYKKAIGEPLTELVSYYIRKQIPETEEVNAQSSAI